MLNEPVENAAATDPNMEVTDTAPDATDKPAESDGEPRVFAISTEDAQNFLSDFLGRVFGTTDDAIGDTDDAPKSAPISLRLMDMHGLYLLLMATDNMYQFQAARELHRPLMALNFRNDAATAMKQLTAMFDDNPAVLSAWMKECGERIFAAMNYVHDLGNNAADYEAMHVNPF